MYCVNKLWCYNNNNNFCIPSKDNSDLHANIVFQSKTATYINIV